MSGRYINILFLAIFLVNLGIAILASSDRAEAELPRKNLGFSLSAGFSGYANPLAFYPVRLYGKGHLDPNSVFFNDLSLTPVTLEVKNPWSTNVSLEVVIYAHSTPLDPLLDRSSAILPVQPEDWSERGGLVPSWMGRRFPSMGRAKQVKSSEEAVSVPGAGTGGGSSEKEKRLAYIPEYLASRISSSRVLPVSVIRRDRIVARKNSTSHFSFPVSIFPADMSARFVGLLVEVFSGRELVFSGKVRLRLLEPDTLYSLAITDQPDSNIMFSSRRILLQNRTTEMTYRPAQIKHGIIKVSPVVLGSNSQFLRHFQFVLIDSSYWRSSSKEVQGFLENAVALGSKLIFYNCLETISFGSTSFTPSNHLDFYDYGLGKASAVRWELGRVSEEIVKLLSSRLMSLLAIYEGTKQDFPLNSAEGRLEWLMMNLFQSEVFPGKGGILDRAYIEYLPLLILWFYNYVFEPSLSQPLEHKQLNWSRSSVQAVSEEYSSPRSDELFPSLLIGLFRQSSAKILARPVVLFCFIAVVVSFILVILRRYLLLAITLGIFCLFFGLLTWLSISAEPLGKKVEAVLTFGYGSYASQLTETETLLSILSGRRSHEDLELQGSNISLKRITPIVNNEVEVVIDENSRGVIKNLSLIPFFTMQVLSRATQMRAMGLTFKLINANPPILTIKETSGEPVRKIILSDRGRLADIGSLSASQSQDVILSGDDIAQDDSYVQRQLISNAELAFSLREYFARRLGEVLTDNLSRSEQIIYSSLGKAFLVSLISKLWTSVDGTYIVAIRAKDLTPGSYAAGGRKIIGSIYLYRVR